MLSEWPPEAILTVRGCIYSHVHDRSLGCSDSYRLRNCSTRLRLTPKVNRTRRHRDVDPTSIVPQSGPSPSSMSLTKPSGDRRSPTRHFRSRACRPARHRAYAWRLQDCHKGPTLCRGGATAGLQTHVQRNLGHRCRSLAITEHGANPPSHGTAREDCPQYEPGSVTGSRGNHRTERPRDAPQRLRRPIGCSRGPECRAVARTPESAHDASGGRIRFSLFGICD